MSDNKKYYYLKLKDNFFDSEEMKILESQKNGVEYQNFYLKLCLLSLKSEGKLMFKDCLPYDINMLSTVLRTNIDTVKTGIEIFKKLGLVDIMESGLIYMSDIQSLIGAGSSEGDRKKLFREKIKQHKMIEGGQVSAKRPPELELELELEIEKDIPEKTDPLPSGKPSKPKENLTPEQTKFRKKVMDKFSDIYLTIYKEKLSWNKKEIFSVNSLIKHPPEVLAERMRRLQRACVDKPAWYKFLPSKLVQNWNELVKVK